MSRFKKVMATLIIFIMSGCVAAPKITDDEVFFTSKVVYTLPANVYGQTSCHFDTLCTIEFNIKTFPLCIKHELRHGHERVNWHEGYNTLWDCEE